MVFGMETIQTSLKCTLDADFRVGVLRGVNDWAENAVSVLTALREHVENGRVVAMVTHKPNAAKLVHWIAPRIVDSLWTVRHNR